ncbi:MAG: hypothetical protein KGS73_13650 [Chloroflexi bacterium]|nr:hypothetical protein [Chloroflexota bacterium]
MQITVGTFNLNNLFSRYNFQAEVELVRQGGTAVEADVRFTFVEPVGYRFRSYQGQLVHAKTPAERKQIADRPQPSPPSLDPPLQTAQPAAPL